MREQRFPLARQELFPFFADAGNLAEITPPFLHFRIRSALPTAIQPGALIDYTIRLFGIPLRWRTRIEAFDPPSGFTDTQLRGPYRRWHHTHEFVEVEGGTLMRDTVEYALPLGPLGRLAHAVFVERWLRRIFDYRRDVLARRFGSV